MAYKQENFSFEKLYPFRLFEISEKQKELHCHNCLELNLVQGGRGKYIIGGKLYPIEPGDVFVINDSEHHLALHDEGDLTLTVLLFAPGSLWKNRHGKEFLKPFLYRKENFSNRIAKGCTGYEDMFFAFSLIRRQMSEPPGSGQDRQIVAEAAVNLLLSLLYCYYSEKQELGPDQGSYHMFGRLDQVFSYIDAHFSEPITLDQLATLTAMSKNYLCKCFKETTGQTLFSYIEQIRIQYACYLLQASDSPVTGVALESGFTSVSYFNRVFRRHCGITPGQFRRSADAIIDSQLPPYGC